MGLVEFALGQTNARLNVRSGKSPSVIQGSDGSAYLAYELNVTARGSDLQLERVRMLDGDYLLSAYDANELDGRTMDPELPRAVRYSRFIRRNTTVVSIWIKLPEWRKRPTSIRHELYGSTTGASVLAKHVLRTDTSAPLVLGPPLRQGLWIAHNGPGDHRAPHWGSMLVHKRQARVPQRYAIDFIGLDRDGRAVRRVPEGSSNSDWPGFGAEVIAVADGRVHETRDGIADNPPLVEPPPPASVELPAVGGNYVLLDLGHRQFVHYLHLQQGSVAVRAGQHVRRGQTLGRLGNSGNTNGAHLHFNVVDRLRLTDAEGLPYVFDEFHDFGTMNIESSFGNSPTPPGTPRDVRRSIPLGGSLVEYNRI